MERYREGNLSRGDQVLKEPKEPAVADGMSEAGHSRRWGREAVGSGAVTLGF